MLGKSSLILLCVFPVILAPAISSDSSTNFLTKLVGSFRGPNGINITQFLSTFQMPACMKQCLPELDGLLMAMSKSNDTRDLSSTHCASNAGCSKVFVEAAASAFQFICLDNIHSLSESVACVKDTALDIQPECEAHCSVQSRIVEDASNNKIEAVFEVPQRQKRLERQHRRSSMNTFLRCTLGFDRYACFARATTSSLPYTLTLISSITNTTTTCIVSGPAATTPRFKMTRHSISFGVRHAFYFYEVSWR
ncbi:unnamed protein product [Heligmosomoides polygyrus]|uniref:CPG4 domain-containing protein n=1 Tax=Heligmosomoides polygyrus TaxID=6339 RepID=A0A183FQH6_HELPZ|nr:unnamed protein product [Heligmosomoides polygyrus]